MLFVFALLVGVIAGLRAMTAPAAVSWAAFFGLLGSRGAGSSSWATASRPREWLEAAEHVLPAAS
jgi:uncharacterized membrane protein